MPAVPLRDSQSFAASGIQEPCVESNKRQRLPDCRLHIETARELNGIAGAEGPALEQAPGDPDDLGRQLDHEESRRVSLERGERTVAFGVGKRPFP